VQAWFMLVERVGVERLLGGVNDGGQENVLEALKRGVGPLVDCFHFGAVLDEGRMWEVVENVLGLNGDIPS